MQLTPVTSLVLRCAEVLHLYQYLYPPLPPVGHTAGHHFKMSSAIANRLVNMNQSSRRLCTLAWRMCRLWPRTVEALMLPFNHETIIAHKLQSTSHTHAARLTC